MAESSGGAAPQLPPLKRRPSNRRPHSPSAAAGEGVALPAITMSKSRSATSSPMPSARKKSPKDGTPTQGLPEPQLSWGREGSTVSVSADSAPSLSQSARLPVSSATAGPASAGGGKIKLKAAAHLLASNMRHRHLGERPGESREPSPRQKGASSGKGFFGSDTPGFGRQRSQQLGVEGGSGALGLSLRTQRRASARRLSSQPPRRSPEMPAEEAAPPPTPEEAAEQARRRGILRKGARIMFAIAQGSRFISAISGKQAAPGLPTSPVVVPSPRPLEGLPPAKGKPALERLLKGSAAPPGVAAVPRRESGGEVGADLLRVALPTAADLHDLPRDLQNTFTSLAMDTLRKFWYPRLLLWKRRWERVRMREECRQDRLSVDVLRRQDMFKDWPAALLDEAVQRLVLESYDRHEFIIHEGEQAGSGIYFVISGTVEVLKKKKREVKAIGGANALKLVDLQPIICVGEFSFLTEEPRMASIRATMRVDCWVLKKNDFADFVKQLPANVFQRVVEVAFAARNKNMHLSYPLTEKVLRECHIFRPCTSAMLQELMGGTKPYAVPKNLRICRGDQMADKIFFLRNGKCGIMRSIQRRIYGRRQSETLIGTLRAPCVIGDSAVIHNGSYGDTVQTLSTCDFWVLSKTSVDTLMRRHRGAETAMMAEARAQRQEQLAHQQNLFRECIYEIPLLRDAATRQQLRTLVNHFDAHVYKPLSVVCSTTKFADRVIILYKGRVRIGPRHADYNWVRGESAGFTCVVPHKWIMPAVSQDIVECLELTLQSYQGFLKQHKIYRQVVQWVKQLLFPCAFPPDVAAETQSYVAHIETPPMYPQSRSTRVNLTEDGFGETHYAHLDYLHRSGHAPAVTTEGAAVPLSPATSLPASPLASPRHGIKLGAAIGGVIQTEELESGAMRRCPTQWTRLSNTLWRKPAKKAKRLKEQAQPEAERDLVGKLREVGQTRRRQGHVFGIDCSSPDRSRREQVRTELWRELF
eukprot:TRINITY_DN3174_c0_g1_i1.p1 TRINITY_DN3174_c0_g1~~TRINITY_DN3174_c0_g1_i1.p1  ORF type:complete len:1018 (+),score=270.26 TRINITY_DN3174_c0_g1_i1:105-3056(+)